MIELALASLAVAAAQPEAEVASAAALVCPDRWGEPGAPLVSTAETARAIFLAVESDFWPQADREEYPAVGTEDGDTYWAVYRYRPAEPRPDGSLLITVGGGQLSMRIDKCDARVHHVFLTR